MATFKVGDRVRRLRGRGPVVYEGSVHTVIEVRERPGAELVLDPDVNTNGWSAEYFQLLPNAISSKSDLEALYG